jgi:hypothetical protein
MAMPKIFFAARAGRWNIRHESLLCRRRGEGAAVLASPFYVDRIMLEQNSNPAFEARSLSSAPGWYVRVVWPHGKREHIPGFVSQREAVRWIEEKAKGWLSERAVFARSA